MAPLADGQELEDPVLDVAEAVVVLVQDPARLDQVEVVRGADLPRDLEHPVQVVADPAVLGALLGGPVEAVELALHLLADSLRHLGVLQLAPVFGAGVARLAQLLLDGFHLLAEQEFALLLLHPLADLGPQLVLEAQVGQGVAVPADDLGQALLDVQRLQDLDLALQ